MYIYAQLNEENVCIGYKNLSTYIVCEDEYVYVGKDININDILYSKYNYESKTFSKEKYYPKVEDSTNEMDAIKEKVNTLEAEKEELKTRIVKAQSAIDFMLMNNGGM